MSMPMDIREQLEGINSLCHHVCSGIKLQQSGLMAGTFRLGFISVKQSDLHKMSGCRCPCRLSSDAFSSHCCEGLESTMSIRRIYDP